MPSGAGATVKLQNAFRRSRKISFRKISYGPELFGMIDAFAVEMPRFAAI